ncbi:MAG: DJ-1/PfpI family protein [Bacteroidota bacterium]
MRPVLFIVLMSVALTASGQVKPDEIQFVCPPCGLECDNLKHEKPGVCDHCNMLLVREDRVKTIAFYLQDGVEVLDFAGPMEVFSYAGYNVFTVSREKKKIKSQGILTVVPDFSIENAPAADILAFFGGNSSAASNDPDVINWVKGQKNIEFYFSVCTGAFVLAEANILKGKIATTFHNALDNLESGYPEIDVRRDVRFVDNGRVITTAGISAGIDGALHLVAKLQGLNTAKRTAYYMEYDNWTPGDGLILSDDDPYVQTIAADKLMAFTGTYEFENGEQIELTYGPRNEGLQAKIGNTVYPLYHEYENVFSDVTGKPVFFSGNDNGQIIGYSNTPEGKLFRKLN